MSKTDELKKEAEEYAEQCYGWCNNDQVTDVAIATYITSAEPREKRIEELEAQIEEMKCCQNCDHYRWSNGDDWCNDHYGQPTYDEECKGKWELRR